MSAKIYIGTSGYSYDDWKDIFYPPKTNRKEFLEFYSKFFNAVEVNFTYYQMPFRRTIEALLRKSGGNMKFVVKAHSSLTHERVEKEEPYIKFQNAIVPLAEAGSLSCVLAQFPFNFKRNPENIKYLERFSKRMDRHPLVIEFRHASWINKDIFTLLENFGIGFCCVDEPKLPGLVPKVLMKTNNIGYLRFHGRNAEKWWKYKDQSERYDYLYNKREIGDWFHRMKGLLNEVNEMYIFFNNHPRAQSIKNAFMMMDYFDMKPEYTAFPELFQQELNFDAETTESDTADTFDESDMAVPEESSSDEQIESSSETQLDKPEKKVKSATRAKKAKKKTGDSDPDDSIETDEDINTKDFDTESAVTNETKKDKPKTVRSKKTTTKKKTTNSKK